MLRSCHCATSFNEIHCEADGASRSTQPTDRWSWPTARVLRIIGGALRDAFAAHRRYEHLRWRGFPHDTALRQALGISDPSERGRCQRGHPPAVQMGHRRQDPQHHQGGE
jgi:hypothetical protein